MIIGIDGNEANADKKVGVHQYAYELLWAIYRIREQWNKNAKVVVYLKSPPNSNLPKEIGYWKYKVISGGGAWVLRKLTPALLFGTRPDVFFSPSHYLPPVPGITKVCTIHDLGYLKFTGHFKKYDFWQLKYWTAISIIISKCIISVSKSTKKDIVRRYPFASRKIKITHHGYDKKRFTTNISKSLVRRVVKKYGISSHYILFLGTLKPSKNIDGLIEAFALVKESFSDYQLVIAGKKGWLYSSIFKKVKKLGLQKDVIFTDFVIEKDKPALLTGAKVFVSPSFWEGFGIHVLEAMACGVPVVVSNIASLPEVVGKAGVYVNPYDTISISKAIIKVLLMEKEEYYKLKNNTIRQAKGFDWKKTAEKTVKILIEANKK